MVKKLFEEVEKILGYQFKKQFLLEAALVHPSAMKRHKRRYDFERLEFLGDRVLGIVIADFIYHKYPQEREGLLAQHQAVLVSRDMCHKVGVEIGLDRFVKFNPKDCQSMNTSIIANAIEAVLGAMFLDGGLAVCKKFIYKVWKVYMSQEQEKDSKTILQEWAQKHKNCTPDYQLQDKTGPDHSPVFTYVVSVGQKLKTLGEGASRKQAEQNAAMNFIEKYKI